MLSRRPDPQLEAVRNIAAGKSPDGGPPGALATVCEIVELHVRDLARWHAPSRTWALTERGKRLAEMGWL